MLVALKREYAEYFTWPEPLEGDKPTVGGTLAGLMGSGGWEGADAWAAGALAIAPTIVGGSKKHGGADLGPTRAKTAWKKLGVDAMGVADEPPEAGWVVPEGKPGTEADVRDGRPHPGLGGSGNGSSPAGKTTRYRQIGNAFPPPVARGRPVHPAGAES